VSPVSSPFRSEVRTILRDRLLDAAAVSFAEQGWRRLTMAKVADRAGVSRQTVYNEFGTKQALAEQLVMRELDVFLDVVREGFESQSEFEPAVRAAVLNALTVAEENALLKAVLEAGHTGDTELLPYIFQSQDVIDTAVGFLLDLVVEHFPDLPLRGEPLAVALESVVRLALSHLTVPARSKSRTADDLAWIAGAVLAGVSTGEVGDGPRDLAAEA
jgi:AcrR family transcriptional regulator